MQGTMSKLIKVFALHSLLHLFEVGLIHVSQYNLSIFFVKTFVDDLCLALPRESIFFGGNLKQDEYRQMNASTTITRNLHASNNLMHTSSMACLYSS